MIQRRAVAVEVVDRSVPLPAPWRVGDQARLVGTRNRLTVLAGQRDGDGSIILVARSQRTGGLRCLRPERVTPVERRKASSARRTDRNEKKGE